MIGFISRELPQNLLLPIIHRFEGGPNGGFASVPYDDQNGHPTIGWGHMIVPSDSFSPPIDQSIADATALSDLSEAASSLQTSLKPGLVSSFTDGQYAALISFIFNEGIGQFAGDRAHKPSTMYTLLKSGQMSYIPQQFGRWVFAGGARQLGLVIRRRVEELVWLGRTAEAAIAQADMENRQAADM